MTGHFCFYMGPVKSPVRFNTLILVPGFWMLDAGLFTKYPVNRR
jgi:hypothetical protein